MGDATFVDYSKSSQESASGKINKNILQGGAEDSTAKNIHSKLNSLIKLNWSDHTQKMLLFLLR